MATIYDVHDEMIDLADQVGRKIGVSRQAVIYIALAYFAAALRLPIETANGDTNLRLASEKGS